MTQIQTSASILHYNPEDPTAMPAYVPIVEKPQPLNTLLASARRLTAKTMKRSTFIKHAAEWQDDAWEMFDLVGEQRFLATTIAGRLAQARIYVGVVNEENAHDTPEPSEDALANEVLESIGGDFSGLARMIERLGVNLFIAGDGWFVGVPESLLDPEKKSQSVLDPNVYMSDLEWFMLSVTEVTFDRDERVTLNVGQGGEKVTVGIDDVYLIRIWKPHPRKMWEADSPTRSSLPVLRELVGLTMHISAQIDSRLAGAGVFLVPQSAQRALKEAAGFDETSDEDVFTESLMEAMMTPISDRSSASAVVPLVVTAPDDSIDKFRHIDFSTPLDDEARELRDEAIRRLALGQDAPPELLLGTGGMNHWGAWLVREDVVSTHLEPTLALICDALTTQYLRPVLSEMGYSDAQLEKLVVWYKVDHMISRPNRGADAQLLYDKGVLSDATLREANGFDDNDAPEQDDDASNQVRKQAVEMAMDLVRSAPTLSKDPGLVALVGDIEGLLQGEEPNALEKVLEDAETETETEDPPANPDAPPATDNNPAPVDNPVDEGPAA